MRRVLARVLPSDATSRAGCVYGRCRRWNRERSHPSRVRQRGEYGARRAAGRRGSSMRTFTRVTAAAAAVALGLTACGGGGDADEPAPTDEADGTTEEPAADDGDRARGGREDPEAATDLAGTAGVDLRRADQRRGRGHPGRHRRVLQRADRLQRGLRGLGQLREPDADPRRRRQPARPRALPAARRGRSRRPPQGNAIALEDLGFDIADLEARFGDYLLSLGEYEGKHYGIPTNANYKCLVWYNIPVFEAEGYEPPETFEDLVALSEQMVDDGYTPWSIGTGSDDATGWPATDFLEDIVLRQVGPRRLRPVGRPTRSRSTTRRSPRRLESFEQIPFGEGFVVGGTSAIPDIDFRDAPAALIGDEPAALMHRQACFITNFFPEGSEFGTDYGVFPFPSIDGNQGALIAGELGVVYDDRPEVREFIEIFTDHRGAVRPRQLRGGRPASRRTSRRRPTATPTRWWRRRPRTSSPPSATAAPGSTRRT